jgi:DNA-binding beta-propeller fold protein YncE
MHYSVGFLIAAPVLFAALQTSGGTVASATKGTLVVVNQLEHAVLFVEPDLRRKFASLAVGVNGHEAAVSPDARFVYVPIYGNAGVGKPGTDGAAIDVIDVEKRSLASSIELSKPLRPHAAHFGPGGFLYVSAELDSTVKIVDAAGQKVVGEIPTGQPQSHMFVFSPDGRRAYTSNVGAGNISVLDIPGRKLVGVIPVAKIIQRISISADGRHLFTHDQQEARLAVIDLASDSGTPDRAETNVDAKKSGDLQGVTHWVELPDVAYASAATPDGKFLLLACPKKHLLLAIDLATLTIAKTFELPGSPVEILVRPDGGVAFVSCMAAGKIAVVDLREWQLREPIVMTPGVDGMAWMPI